MSPEALAIAPALREPQHPERPLRIVDVTVFYGERSGGIRTYLQAKAAYAAATGAFEHYLVVPGRQGCSNEYRRELPSIRMNGSNGYRVPLGGSELQATLTALRPDIVLLHDPFWTPKAATAAAHDAGALVVAVHHSSAAQHASAIGGPGRATERALRRWYRRAYQDVDAVMSAVDPHGDCGRAATLPLRLGLDPAFRPHPEVERQSHVLYVGRFAKEKGLRHLLQAAASAGDSWPLVLRGAGPAEGGLRERAAELGIADRVMFAPFLSDRSELARAYAEAACVVVPGSHETFGLVALEAAACGARVVAAACTPSVPLLGGLAETFRPGDPADLRQAIDRARAGGPQHDQAEVLRERHSWEAALTAELDDLRSLVCG